MHLHVNIILNCQHLVFADLSRCAAVIMWRCIVSLEFLHCTLWLVIMVVFCHSDAAVTQFGLICGLCLGLMVLVVTATFHTGFYCNNKK